jgi:uncharacterized protein YqgC (DUF456 family)
MTSFLISVSISTVAFVCWVATVLGLPGNWLLVIAATAIAWFVPTDLTCHVSWLGVGVLVALATVGELIEFIAGAIGVGKTGGSKRAAALALAGSLIGAMVGFVLGLPIPVVGGLVGSLLFSGLGAAVGAIIGQRWFDKNWDKTMKVGIGAFWGRLLGTLGKAICGALMVIVLLFYVWL